MRFFPYLVASGLVASGLSGGCGGGEEELGLSGFLTKAEATYCEWSARCGGFADAATCEEAVFFDVLYPLQLLGSGRLRQDDGKLTVEYLRAAVEAGRIVYDAEAAEACLAYVADRGCLSRESHAPDADEVAGRAACASIFAGTLVDGATCGHAIECQNGGYCQEEFCDQMCCGGTCEVPAVVPLGMSCSFADACEEGSVCVFDESKLDYVCAALKAEGVACQGGDCEAGLVCDYQAARCVKVGEIGDSCVSFSDGGCVVGALCVDPDFDGQGRCEAYKKIGERCDGGDCRDLDAVCDRTLGECVKAPGGGEPCTPDFACAAWANCDGSTMKCVAEAKTGEPCGSGTMGGVTVGCAGDLQCNGGSLQVNECLTPASYACPLPEN